MEQEWNQREGMTGREALLLGNAVNVGADDEGDEVEEGDPGVLGQELLGEGQADRDRLRRQGIKFLGTRLTKSDIPSSRGQRADLQLSWKYMALLSRACM